MSVKSAFVGFDKQLGACQDPGSQAPDLGITPTLNKRATASMALFVSQHNREPVFFRRTGKARTYVLPCAGRIPPGLIYRHTGAGNVLLVPELFLI